MKNILSLLKKARFRKLLFLPLTMALLVTSCTELDEPLYSQLGNDNFLKTEDEIVSALGAAYAGLRKFHDFGNMWTTYCTTDEVAIVARTGGDWGGDGQDQQMTDHTWIANNRFFAGTWLSYYGEVNNCNRLIFQLEKLDPEKYKTYISEVKIVRAIWYLLLMDGWGNIPIVDRFDVPQGYLPVTSGRSDVYAFIEKEVSDNLGNLTRDKSLSTYGRADYWTGLAILAKLYLNAEVYTGVAQWKKAEEVTGEIISSGKFSMTPSYRENFISQNQNSPEAILAIPFDDTYTQWAWMLPLISLHYSSQQTFNMTNQPWNGLSVQTDFFNLYEENDIRRDNNFLYGPQFTFSGEPLTDPGYEKDPAVDPDGPQINFTTTFNSLYNAARQNGVRIKKWEIETGSNGSLSSDFFLFRYTDIVLMHAEALWRQNPASTEALELFNSVRRRAEVPEFTALDEEKIVNERGRELFYEGWRRNDLIRFDRYNDPTVFRPQKSEAYRKLFPIPKDQIDANPNLKQNPGY